MSFNKFIIDVKALKYNAKKIKEELVKGVKLCAVVKANAYGHGSKIVAKNLENLCDFFAVACLKEAVELRKYNIKKPILILGLLSKSDIKQCFDNDISINISSITQLTEYTYILNELKNRGNKKLKIHIKINTGLNRLGVSSISEFKEILNFISKSDVLELEGIFTHFATKANDHDFILEQYSKFEKYKNLVDDKCIIIHCNNSYATLNFKKFSNSMVRCGFAIYGWLDGFKPVLSIKTSVVQINNVDCGSVGYDRTYIANKRKIAVIPIGYADGFDRRLSNNFKVLVNDVFVPVVGNICMDMTMLDVTDVEGVGVGSVVTILGADKNNSISVYDFANALVTSPYDVLLKFRSCRMDLIEL